MLKSFSGNLSSGSISIWNNGINLTQQTATLSQTNLPNIQLTIGATNSTTGVQFPDNKLLSGVSIGSGLTDTQIVQRDTIWNNAQHILGRA